MSTDPKEIGCGCLVWIMIIAGAWWWFSRDDTLNDLSPTQITSIQNAEQLLNGDWVLDYKETFSSNKMMKNELNKFSDDNFNKLPQIVFNFDMNKQLLQLFTVFNKKTHFIERGTYRIKKFKKNYIEINSPLERSSVKIEFFDNGNTIRVKGDKPFLYGLKEFETKYAILHKVNSD